MITAGIYHSHTYYPNGHRQSPQDKDNVDTQRFGIFNGSGIYPNGETYTGNPDSPRNGKLDPFNRPDGWEAPKATVNAWKELRKLEYCPNKRIKTQSLIAMQLSRHLLVGLAFITILKLPSYAGADHLIPVDGRIGGWNAVWKRLSSDITVPQTRDLVATLVEEVFQQDWLVRVKITDTNDAVVILTSCDSIKPGGVAQCIKVIPFELSTELNTLWVSSLLHTHYPEKADDIVMDGISAVFGATTDDRLNYMMGTAKFPSNKGLMWMLECAQLLKAYTDAKTIADEQAIIKQVWGVINARREQGNDASVQKIDKNAPLK